MKRNLVFLALVLLACGAESNGTGSRVSGISCTTDAECTVTGHCSDGVCCNTACGGGVATDCQACSVAAGGTMDGTCTLSKLDTVCRASTGACDPPERCDGKINTCPANTVTPVGGTCPNINGFWWGDLNDQYASQVVDWFCTYPGTCQAGGACRGGGSAGGTCVDPKLWGNDADCHEPRYCNGLNMADVNGFGKCLPENPAATRDGKGCLRLWESFPAHSDGSGRQQKLYNDCGVCVGKVCKDPTSAPLYRPIDGAHPTCLYYP